jgi:hypothetical protein
VELTIRREWVSQERKDQVSRLIGRCAGRIQQVQNAFEAFEKEGLYSAPASSIHHRNYDGGLIDHAIGVTKTLLDLRVALFVDSPDFKGQPSEESCVIVGIFHDLHKCCDGFGRSYYVPNVLKSGKVSDAKPYERNSECMAMLGGYASVLLLLPHVPLFEQEIQAIACHDGQYVSSNKEVALKEHPLTVMLHFADYWNAIVIEDRDSWMYREVSGRTLGHQRREP